MAQAVAVTPRR